jgi:hypothetical protein
MNRFNSTIKIKEGPCIVCVNEEGDETSKKLIKGKCTKHYHRDKKSEYAIRKYIANKPPLRISHHIIIPVTICENPLDEWFDEKIRILAKHPFCMECNSLIPPAYYHAAVAHIFQKSIFKSIATHPFNYLFLGAGCGCHNRSHRLDTFSKMKVFPEAVDRFVIFRESIKERHKYLDLFIDYAKKIA